MSARLLVFFLFLHLFSCQNNNIESKAIIPHPMEPLNEVEITSLKSILSQHAQFTADHRFCLVDLKDPDKNIAEPDRVAFTLLYDWNTRITSEVEVNLRTQEVLSWKDLVASSPPNTAIAADRAKEFLLNDPDFISTVEALGIEDIADLGFQAIPMQDEKNISFYSAYAWVNDPKRMDQIGLSIFTQFDSKSGRIFGRNNSFGKYFVRKGTREYRLQKFLELPKENSPAVIITDPNWPARKPLSIQQSKGSGFQVNGSKVNWQNWEIHFGMDPRSALEIFEVGYQQNDTLRKIIHKAGLSEAVTPYGDPKYRSFYPADVGEMHMATYGLRPMVPGEDTPDNAILLPTTLYNHLGDPVIIENAIAIYERDRDIVWRHEQDARRARELVIKTNVIIDNYDFSMSWIFNQAGGLEAEMLLSGQVQHYKLPNHIDLETLEERTEHYFTVVAPSLAAPIHQHYFNYRVDLDVDGVQNSIYEMNLEPAPDSANESGEWFYYEKTLLSDEQSAQRTPSVHKSRHWRISNDNKRTALNQSPSYILMPTGNAFPKLKDNAPVLDRFGFLKKQLWVSPYQEAEKYASGLYTNPEFELSGLPVWTKANRNLVNEDLVLWYTFGMTHLPRPEDWPYMPIHRRGFKLWPYGFFTQNPAIGIPDGNYE